MVRKLKNQENIESSYDDLFICEEKVEFLHEKFEFSVFLSGKIMKLSNF